MVQEMYIFISALGSGVYVSGDLLINIKRALKFNTSKLTLSRCTASSTMMVIVLFLVLCYMLIVRSVFFF
ncbi:hypothetical protein OIU78_003264 [Salix suchowensis]|nr:hypothetical protein OIU78_003264 [Salix suchowensis]